MDWGVQPDHLEGRFVSALMMVIRALSGLVTAATTDVKEIIRGAKETAELEIARLKEANKLAVLTIREAELAQEKIITSVSHGLVKNITAKTGEWLVIEETYIHRKRARIYAVKMTLAALALVGGSFVAGNQYRSWADEPALDMVARCVRTPYRVMVAGEAKSDLVCRMGTLAPRELQDVPDELKRVWLKLWPFFARSGDEGSGETGAK